MKATCAECGIELPDSLPGHGCPNCLLMLGLVASGGASPEAPRSGDRVGPWRLGMVIRHGPAASVFRATDTLEGQDVVVKFLAPSLLEDEVAYHRFQLEATRRLVHPHLAPVLGSGFHQGVPYFVVPFFAGGSLADWVRRTWKKGVGGDAPGRGDMDFHQVARWGRDIALAVGHLHQEGVIHRDLKPANVFLDDAQAVRVGDFGISSHASADARLTPTGLVIGTLGYMAPEWLSGEVSGGTLSTDIFGIGAILLDLLTGAPPYPGESLFATMQSAASKPPPSPFQRNSHVPRDLDRIVAKCLAHDPGRRYRSALEVGEDLDRFLRGEAPVAESPTAWGQLRDWGRRHPFYAGALGSALAAGFLVAATSLVALRQVSEARDQSREVAEARRREMVRLRAERGVDSLSRHRPGEAMAWFAAAWASDVGAGVPKGELELHASSFDAARARLPAPVQVVELCPEATCLWSAPGASNLVAAARNGAIMGWPVLSPLPRSHAYASSNAFMGFFPQEDALWLHERGPSNQHLLLRIPADPAAIPRSVQVPAGVIDVASSPDGRWLAVALDDHPPLAWILDASTLAPHGVIRGHADRIRRVAWVGAELLVTASWDGTVRLWESSGVPLATWQTGEYVRDLVVDPRGRWLAFGGDDRRLHLVDLRSRAEAFAVSYPAWVMCLAVSRDGSLVAAGDRDGNLCAWDPLAGTRRMTWTRHSFSEIRRLAFNPAGSRLAVGSADQALRVVSVSVGSTLLATLPTADERAACTWLSDDSLASIPFPGIGVVWKVPAADRSFPSWLAPADSTMVGVSSDNRLVAAASAEEVAVFDALAPLAPPVSHRIHGELMALGFSRDCRSLMTISKDGALQSMGLQGQANDHGFQARTGLRINHAILEPSGDRWLAVTEDARLVAIPAVPEPAWLSTGSLQPPPVESKLVASPDQRSFVLALSPSQGRASGIARLPGLWLGTFPSRPGTEKPLDMPGNCSSAAFSPDSRRIAAGTWDGRLRIFDALDGSPATPLRDQGAPVRCLMFDRTGRVVITGSTDRHIRFWDVETGAKISPDIEMESSVAMLQRTPAGDMVGIANDGSLRLWATDTWRPIFLRAATDGPVRRFALSPDAGLLAISSKERLLAALRMARSTLSYPEALLWLDLLAPYRISASGAHEAISPARRLDAWRQLSASR